MSEIEFKQKSDLKLYVSDRALDFLTSEAAVEIQTSLSDSWHRICDPPVGMSPLDVFICLLSSMSYTMNPSTIRWQDATDMTFRSLWMIVNRVCSKYNRLFPELKRILNSRTKSGYIRSRKTAETQAHSDVNSSSTIPLDNVEGLMDYLDAVKYRRQVKMDIDKFSNILSSSRVKLNGQKTAQQLVLKQQSEIAQLPAYAYTAEGEIDADFDISAYIERRIAAQRRGTTSSSPVVHSVAYTSVDDEAEAEIQAEHESYVEMYNDYDTDTELNNRTARFSQAANYTITSRLSGPRMFDSLTHVMLDPLLLGSSDNRF
jgi:hypothetical protein